MSDSPRPRRVREWIIEGILPTRVVGLLAGPPGVGKSSGMLPWLADIQAGREVFGRPTHPVPIVVVSCDRSEEEYFSHLEALGLAYDQFFFFDQTMQRTSLELIVKACAKKWPGCLIFIEGFAMLVPGVNLKDYGVVAEFLLSGADLARRNNVTIIGCVHTPKEKDGQGYGDPRSQISGSVAWTGFSNVSFVVQRKDPRDPQNRIRLVHVLTRAEAGDFTLPFEKDPLSPGGRLKPFEDKGDKELMDFCLDACSFDNIFPTKHFMEYGQKQSIGEYYIERWITSAVKDGRLEKVTHGRYRRIRVS